MMSWMLCLMGRPQPIETSLVYGSRARSAAGSSAVSRVRLAHDPTSPAAYEMSVAWLVSRARQAPTLLVVGRGQAMMHVAFIFCNRPDGMSRLIGGDVVSRSAVLPSRLRYYDQTSILGIIHAYDPAERNAGNGYRSLSTLLTLLRTMSTARRVR